MVYRSQIVLSKMFTAQRMYNYSANSILSGEWCGVLAFFEECDIEGVLWLCCYLVPEIPLRVPDPPSGSWVE